MENPEEVLQALDEFQKLRPADIPKELEEYLSWVAKTGDPVYQWPLIKALFREKLLRVMTDFYESCPTLELATCPNVEQFNYDIMKSALLDRLESFVNAPFTVQRICELLTAPRKEYNRVDKFMRAIEKNILVVSTREPGSAARRSENGDGMVNGSSEDNGSRSPYEMDLWTRACTLATTVTVQTVETQSTIVNIHHLATNIVPATDLANVKSNLASTEAFTPYGTDPDTCDSEMTSKNQDLPSTFTPSTSEIASIANLTSQIQPQDLNSTSGIQNLSNMVSEPSSIVGDVPEAIMNEDTNSQPSLDMESNENESFESNRKLQTTFQSSDFIAHGIKSQKFYSEDSKPTEKTIVEAETLRTHLEPVIELDQKTTEEKKEDINPNLEGKSTVESGEPTVPATEITADSIEMTETVDKIINAEPSIQSTVPAIEINETLHRSISNHDETQVKDHAILDNEYTTLLKNGAESDLLDVSINKDDIIRAKVNVCEESAPTPKTTLVSTPSPSTATCMVETNVSITQDVTIAMEKNVKTDSKDFDPISEQREHITQEIQSATEDGKESDIGIESRECTVKDEKISDLQQPLTTIEDISNEADTKIISSIIPDPLPIIEEPKDEESVSVSEEKQAIVDIASEEQSKALDTAVPSRENQKELVDSVETVDVFKLNEEAMNAEPDQTFPVENPVSVVSDLVPMPDAVSTECMEVDVAEGSQTFQQDEPMEEEVSDLDKS